MQARLMGTFYLNASALRLAFSAMIADATAAYFRGTPVEGEMARIAADRRRAAAGTDGWILDRRPMR